ncbi:hypothetical protein ISCGN_007856 [Ixodes scapularis]
MEERIVVLLKVESVEGIPGAFDIGAAPIQEVFVGVPFSLLLSGAAWVPCCSFSRGTLSTEQEREARSSLGGDLGEGEGAAAAGLSLDGGAARVPPPGAGGSCCCPCRGAGALRSAAKVSGETCVALDSECGAGPLRTTRWGKLLPLRGGGGPKGHCQGFKRDLGGLRFRSRRRAPAHRVGDTRLREAGAEVVYCLTRGAPKGPNLPRVRLNHQDALFPGHGKATHSQTWAGEPAWLGVRGDATLQTPAFTGAPCGGLEKFFFTCVQKVVFREDSTNGVKCAVCQFRRGRRPGPRVSGHGQTPPKKSSTYQAETLPHSHFRLLTLMEQQVGPVAPKQGPPRDLNDGLALHLEKSYWHEAAGQPEVVPESTGESVCSQRYLGHPASPQVVSGPERGLPSPQERTE